ncbi:MAG: AI-2E family transporter [Propionibacteriales bacterium]|nr:AI-2E family transporter [Propionibacteriales bacterium]
MSLFRRRPKPSDEKHERALAADLAHAERESATDDAVRDADSSGTPRSEADFVRAVPWGMQIAAGWSWRLLIVAAAVLGVGWVLAYFSGVTIPIAVAILLAALLQPLINMLTRWGFPRILSVVIGLLAGVLVVVGVLTLIVWQIASQSGELAQQTVAGVHKLLDWLASGPLKISEEQINQYQQQITDWAAASQGVIAGYAAKGATGVGNFVAGLAISLFALFFFLYEGSTIWNFLLRFVPGAARQRTDVAARVGWKSLVGYVRATVIVAGVDAVGVLIVALILGVPLAPALAALVFLGAFVPIVGALVTGFVAVAVALVALGWVQALIMLAGVVLVMQLESNILQPFLLGKAVSLHPFAVLLGITIGITIGGIVGGLIAIPVMAFGNSFVSALTRQKDQVQTQVATG